MERITFKRESTVPDLTDRLFGTKLADSETRSRVQDALQSANPHIGAFDQLPRDMPLSVPTVAGIDAASAPHPFEATLNELVAQVQSAVGDLSALLGEAAARQVVETRADAAYVDSRAFISSAVNDPTNAEAIAAEAKNRANEAKVLKTFQAKAITQVENDLNELGSVFTRLATQTIRHSFSVPGGASTAAKESVQKQAKPAGKASPPKKKRKRGSK